MPLRFTASNQGAHFSATAVSAFPITILCRFRILNVGDGVDHHLCGLYNQFNDDGFSLRWIGSNRRMSFASKLTGATVNTPPIHSLRSTEWQVAAGVVRTTTSRFGYLNNERTAEQTSSQAFPTIFRGALGGRSVGDGSYDSSTGHEICDHAIWAAALTHEEIARIVAGASPMQVRPDALRRFVPVVGGDVFDVIRGETWTIQGTPLEARRAPTLRAQLERQRIFARADNATGATGTLAATEAQDSASFAGIVGYSTGTLAATEGQDTATFAGSVIVTGTLAATEGQDSAVFSPPAAATGTLAATEAQDTAAFAGAVIVTGTLAATEGQDVAAITGELRYDGSFAAQEAADVAAFTGELITLGTLAAVEGQDAASFAGAGIATGTLAATEGQDTCAMLGYVASEGTLAANEGQDSAQFSGPADATGTLAATEAQDSAAFMGIVANVGTLAATEGQDTALFFETLAAGNVERTIVAPYLSRLLLATHSDRTIAALHSDRTIVAPYDDRTLEAEAA